jgi:hypothetical protein
MSELKDHKRQASILNADRIVEDLEWDEQCRRESQAYEEYVAMCVKEGSPALSQVQWLEKKGYFLSGCEIPDL